MAQKKAYSRYFIILQQDESGYSLASDKLPSGYTKLETKNDKCKISYYVQNLKKEHEPYYMALICNKKDAKKLIKLGMMNIDDYGRAEITHEYSVDNIAGTNIPMDMITGAAIVKLVDKDIVSVMSGFSTTDVPSDWKSYAIIDMTRKDETADPKEPEHIEKQEEIKVEKKEDSREEIKQENKEENNIFEEYEKKIEEVKASVKAEEIRDENKAEIVEETVQKVEESETEAIEKSVQRLEETEENEPVEEVVQENSERAEGVKEEQRAEEKIEDIVVKTNDTRDKKMCKHEDNNMGKNETHKEHDCKHENNKSENEKHQEKDNDNKHDYDPEADCPKGTVGEFFKALAEEFEEVKDVCKEIKKCKWYRVPVKTLDELCNQTNYNKYTVVYYPMISYYPYIKNHGYYLLGYKYDSSGKMKYLVYGIPGTKRKSDQPYGGKSGFVTWVPLNPGEERDHDMGHWLMFYDFRTSTIVIPVK